MDTSFVLAAVLLTSPPAGEPIGDTLPRPVPAAWVAVLKPSLQAIAVADEVLDPRELSPGCQLDLPDLQGRWQALKDAPRIGELARWPDRATLDSALSLNRSVRNYLHARRSIDVYHEDELRAAVEDLDCLYNVVDLLRDATAPAYYLSVRRSSLASFRDRIGAAAWAAGDLPDCAAIVPVDEPVKPDLRRRLPAR